MFVNMDSLYDVCLLSIMKGFDGSLTLENILVMRKHFHRMLYEFTVVWALGRGKGDTNEKWEGGGFAGWIIMVVEL